ncbi:MAG: hypothetical protein K2Y28_03925 [Burkholderiaceae bacterium]|nr:hypothetical protein [Burkholderiaceae bacterium]
MTQNFGRKKTGEFRRFFSKTKITSLLEQKLLHLLLEQKLLLRRLLVLLLEQKLLRQLLELVLELQQALVLVLELLVLCCKLPKRLLTRKRARVIFSY